MWIKTIIMLLLVCLAAPALSQKQLIQKQLAQTRYQSVHEFAQQACLPCHYGPKGTVLKPVFAEMSETELAAYLTQALTQTQMPPDNVFREILTQKLQTLTHSLALNEEQNH